MNSPDSINKLNVSTSLKKTYSSFIDDLQAMLLFSLVNFVFLLVFFLYIKTISHSAFLLWCIPYYVLWCFFFRYIFNRKPYCQLKVFADSLVPSTKIFMLTILVMLVFIALPMLPLYISMLFGISNDMIPYMDKYSDFLQVIMDDTSILNNVLGFVFAFLSPFIFYRPFYAWISSVIGRSGSVRTAFARTKGNYWRFVYIGLVVHLLFILFSEIFSFTANIISNEILYLLVMSAVVSPILVFFNLFLAKTYEFFFLETINSNQDA